MAQANELIVIGGGLAGTEAAWQAAEQGINVYLYEMRPQNTTPAHTTEKLAELVCSNSLGSDLPDRAPGLLKNELRRLNSLLIQCAEESAVPAGGALAVDREVFADIVTTRLANHPKITVIREEVKAIPNAPCVIATGPLTADALAVEIANLVGQEYLHFYDALAPIVEVDSIDMSIAYRASRYGRGEQAEGDYINCPLNEDQYYQLVNALVEAETITLREFESEDPHFFEGCLPVEQIANRGKDALAFGPLRPVGLENPHTGNRPYAVVQLRQDNLAGTLYNLVGFQTNLRWAEQKQVLRLIPGLENANFTRFGQMHRNTFINSPQLLHANLAYKKPEWLFFAGQLTGIEGYVGNIGTGLLAGLNSTRKIQGLPLLTLPVDTMLGALCHYISHANPKEFQPMKANFGLMPPFEKRIRNKRERYSAYAERAIASLEEYLLKNLSSTNS
ncbi:FADH(2)-oxidizing methylenetetrahydrofolate--tRNA-(uracil(54)-C(5))-methyltransferase TrmFO [Chloroflexota bacterium]